jgi:hypothetical protein
MRRVPPSGSSRLLRPLSSVNRVAEDRCGSELGSNGKKVTGSAVMRSVGVAHISHLTSRIPVCFKASPGRAVGPGLQAGAETRGADPTRRPVPLSDVLPAAPTREPVPRSLGDRDPASARGATWGAESPLGFKRQLPCRCTGTAVRLPAEEDGVTAGCRFQGAELGCLAVSMAPGYDSATRHRRAIPDPIPRREAGAPATDFSSKIKAA